MIYKVVSALVIGVVAVSKLCAQPILWSDRPANHWMSEGFPMGSGELGAVPLGKTGIDYNAGGGSYINLLCAHPPFQIDGNFGAVSAIAEMLLQSHTGEIELLPALPSAWPEGSVKGLRARGGFEIDLDWKAGQLVSATLRNPEGEKGTLRSNEKPASIQISKGESVRLGPELKPL